MIYMRYPQARGVRRGLFGWLGEGKTLPICVILSAGRRPKSNFCSVEYPLRKQDTEQSKSANIRQRRMCSGICERFMTRLLSQSYI